MSDLLISTVVLEIEAAAGAERPARISAMAYSGGVLPIGGNRYIISLDGLTLPASVPLLRDHENQVGAIAGMATPAKKGGSLFIEGTLARGTPAADAIIALVKAGVELAVSVGVEPEARQYITPGQKIQANGQTFIAPDGGLVLVSKSTLREISIVAVGADRSAVARIAASRKERRAMDENEWVLSNQTKETLHANFHSGMPDPELEAKRLQLIGMWSMRVDANTPPEIRAKAIDLRAKATNGEITLDELRMGSLELLRAERPKGPQIRASTRDYDGSMIEAAMCQTLNLRNIETHFSPDVLQSAHTAFRGRIGLQQVLLMAAGNNGFTCRMGEKIHDGNLREVLRYAFPPLQAGFADTLNLPNIFSNAANKQLLAGFMEEDQAWRSIAVTGPVNDFKPHTRHRLLDNFEYDEMPPGGEIKHGQVGEDT